MKIIQSKLLKQFKNLSHGFTLREGGVSKGTYSSLNVALHVGDLESDVIQNHILLAKKLNYKYEKLVFMNQIHSDKVHLVFGDENFKTPVEADALITQTTDTPLMVMVADCTPVLFYDTTKKVIGVAHVGRAGAFKNIIQNLVNNMVKTYSSNPKHIIAVSGASIGECCYEVDTKIYDETKKLKLDYAITQNKTLFYLDIKKIIKKQLLDAGIKEKNIEISDVCNCCNHNEYFSYRASKRTGRFCGVIMLR